jgi:hypothetical protein
MTKQEALELIDAYEASPDGFATCDNLCAVVDGLGIDDESEYTADELREMVEELL